MRALGIEETDRDRAERIDMVGLGLRVKLGLHLCELLRILAATSFLPEE